MQTLSEWLDPITTIATLGVVIIGWYIKGEINKFRLEILKDRSDVITNQTLLRADLINHISNDEDFQERTERSLDSVHDKLDEIKAKGR